MTSYIRTILMVGLVSLFAVSGCVKTKFNAQPESSAITFSQSSFWLERGENLFWHTDLLYLDGEAREKPQDVQPFLKREIENYFVLKNNFFVEDKSTAKYSVVAVMILGDGASAHDVLKQYGLSPSFKGNRRYEKGTILVAVLDAGDDSILWRGALQANVRMTLPAEQRRERVRDAIAGLLKNIPRHKRAF